VRQVWRDECDTFAVPGREADFARLKKLAAHQLLDNATLNDLLEE